MENLIRQDIQKILQLLGMPGRFWVEKVKKEGYIKKSVVGEYRHVINSDVDFE